MMRKRVKMYFSFFFFTSFYKLINIQIYKESTYFIQTMILLKKY